VRLTTRWTGAGGPAWSPSGRYLAFARGTSPGSKIVVADARGRILWRFGGATYNGAPLWSPDGSHIAYSWSVAHAFGLAVARPNGSYDRGVAASPGFPTYGPAHPAWTADGRRLAFDDGNFVDTPQGIFTVAVDGSDRRLLVPDAISPAFSSDGSKLAYVAFDNWRPGGVFVANADGSSPRAVASQSGQLSWGTPAWSPDGRRLAFTQNTLLNGRVVRQDLVVERADGSGERVVSSAASPRGFSDPVWSPDGRFIAFARYPSGALVVVGAKAGRPRVVAHSMGGLAWRPAVALPAANRHRCHTR
jgi:Tol biopolymer transport system component